jgi:DNA-binding LytR/AlgR family response regulator
MPELDGLDVMNSLAAREGATPKIIFVTAYDEYAVRAFEVRAFDYRSLFDGARIDAALERVRGQVELEHRPARVGLLWSMLDRIMHIARARIRNRPRHRRKRTISSACACKARDAFRLSKWPTWSGSKRAATTRGCTRRPAGR